MAIKKIDKSKPYQHTITVDNKEEAIWMCFSPFNADSKKYIEVQKALPKIKGLKRSDKRMEFAFDLIENIRKNNHNLTIEKL